METTFIISSKLWNPFKAALKIHLDNSGENFVFLKKAVIIRSYHCFKSLWHICNCSRLILDKNVGNVALKPMNHSKKLWKYIRTTAMKTYFTSFNSFTKVTRFFRNSDLQLHRLDWYSTNTQATCTIGSKARKYLRGALKTCFDKRRETSILKKSEFSCGHPISSELSSAIALV